MNFSEKLLKMRKEQKLSQEELADKLDVTRQSVSKWESGQTYPEMDKLLAICKIFNCTLEELTNDEIKVEEFNKESKINIVELILDYIKRTYNYFANISFKEFIKVLLTMVVVLLILHLLHYPFVELENIIRDAASYIKEGFITRFISGISSFIIDIIYSFGSIFIFFYIFKIGFLDKKAIIISEKVVEVEGKEKEEVQTKVIKTSNSGSSIRLFDIIGKIIMFFIKVFLIFFAIPFVMLIVFLSCFLAFSIGLMFRGVVFIGAILGLIFAIMLISLIIEFISNIVLNHKHNAKRMIITLLIGLVGGGISAGILTMEMSKYEFIDGSPTQIEETKKSYNFTYKKGMYINSFLGGYTSHLDESMKDNDIIIEVYNYKYSSEIFLEEHDNIIVLTSNAKKEIKPSEYVDLIIKALKEKKIYSSLVDHNSRFIVIANSKTLKLLEDNIDTVHYNRRVEETKELQNEIRDLNDTIRSLEKEKEELRSQNDKLESKILEYKEKVASLID